jgi:hypothetical protein
MHSFINQYPRTSIKKILLSTNVGLSDGHQRKSSAAKYNMNHDHIMQAPAIHTQYLPDTPQQVSYIHQIPQQALYAQQEPHQTTHMPQIPILPQQPIKPSTHPKQQQQAQDQSKQQTSRKP